MPVSCERRTDCQQKLTLPGGCRPARTCPHTPTEKDPLRTRQQPVVCHEDSVCVCVRGGVGGGVVMTATQAFAWHALVCAVCHGAMLCGKRPLKRRDSFICALRRLACIRITRTCNIVISGPVHRKLRRSLLHQWCSWCLLKRLATPWTSR